MKFDIITIFPKIFNSYFNESILKRAQKKRLIKIEAHDLRRWASDKHKTVDDKPYGGGVGMIFKIEPIYRAVKDISDLSFPRKRESRLKTWIPAQGRNDRRGKNRVVLFSAKGKQFNQADAKRLAKYDQLILICGRYEGVDERVAEHIADEEISVGNFVLTGGEIPAMILVDSISRLIPGVLGKKESLNEESHSKEGYLEYAQYTRPENFKKWKVPKVLLSGNHKEIGGWRRKMSQKISNS
ncbi:MAG: tRNA (guanosine(37)-N1)-methyltransferase TrmD [Candidatus Portnoybacteria bacterium]|nr:tRNA (guanosine(37)-N1)-methyltransferase TrmD [Candidatus Portnoybacteria bacterium]